MTELISIQDLDPLALRVTLRQALLEPNPVRCLSDFLLSVDWSTTDGPIPEEVAVLLDEAEQLTTAAEEGDLSLEVFIAAVSELASSALEV